MKNRSFLIILTVVMNLWFTNQVFAVEDCRDLFAVQSTATQIELALARNEFIASGVSPAVADEAIQSELEFCKYAVRSCVRPSLLRLARIEPTLIDITIDHEKLSDPYFSKTLSYPPTLEGFIKSKAMNSPLRKLIRSVIFSKDADEITGPFLRLIFDRLKVGVPYNIVLVRNHLLLAPVSEVLVNNILSKHLLLADGSFPSFAGTLELLPDGTWELSNSSGSFQPGEDVLIAMQSFLQQALGLKNVKIFTNLEMKKRSTLH